MRTEPFLRISGATWHDLTRGLHQRTEGCHEAGAFLLGRRTAGSAQATDIIYYDELEPGAYDTGICVLHASAFGLLWDRCAARDLTVVADAHVHPFGAGQSLSDIRNPMIARPGHLALILPFMARPPIRRWTLGLYEYLGEHRWRSLGGRHISRSFKIEDSP